MTFQWAQAVIGLWMIVSPWLFGVGSNTLILWSNVIAGLALVLITLWQMFGKG